MVVLDCMRATAAWSCGSVATFTIVPVGGPNGGAGRAGRASATATDAIVSQPAVASRTHEDADPVCARTSIQVNLSVRSGVICIERERDRAQQDRFRQRGAVATARVSKGNYRKPPAIRGFLNEMVTMDRTRRMTDLCV